VAIEVQELVGGRGVGERVDELVGGRPPCHARNRAVDVVQVDIDTRQRKTRLNSSRTAGRPPTAAVTSTAGSSCPNRTAMSRKTGTRSIPASAGGMRIAQLTANIMTSMAGTG
jgi:hypothetical protein